MIISITFLLVCTKISEAIFKQSEYQKRGCQTNLKLQKLDADYIIGGFIPAHTENSSKLFNFNLPAVAWSAAIVYAVNEINKDEKLLPGITLGYDIRDSCDDGNLAISYLLELMMDSNYMRPTFNASKYMDDICINKNDSFSIVAGIIGGASSSLSTFMNTVLSADFIPQISYSATSTLLSKKYIYRSFLRTVPSDVLQAAAIAELLEYFGWTYVSAFASDDDYGRIGLDEFRVYTKEKKICLSGDRTFNQRPSKDEINEIMNHLSQYKHTSHVVILWCSSTDAKAIVETARNLGLVNITWIATETWGKTENMQQLVTGNLIALEIWQPEIAGFKDFFVNDKSNCDNPWYKLYALNVIGDCGFAVDLGVANVYRKPKYPQVIAAVYALARGLHRAIGCSNGGKCTKVNRKLDYKAIYENIVNSDFLLPGSVNYQVTFNDTSIYSSNPTYRFSLLNKHNTGYTIFGNWSAVGKLKINKAKLLWGKKGKPVAHCSAECEPGFYQIKGYISCCWSCAQCPSNKISTTYNQEECKACSEVMQIANHNQTTCIDLSKLSLLHHAYFGVVIIATSCLGVVLTGFVMVVFLIQWDTPMVKSSSREMSFIQLTSLLLLFCLPSVYMLHLSIPVCILRTLIFGYLFTTVVSIILIKTYRLHRVFNERFTKVSKFLHNRYQIFFSYAIVLVQVIFTVLFHTNFQPNITVDRFVDDSSYYVNCGKQEPIILWIILGYVFILALLSGYMAFRARKLPENFNETHFITFAMFTACVLWLMYIPLYASLTDVEQSFSFLLVNFISTLTILVILYGYKIRIMLFYPQYNSPEHFRKTAVKSTISHFRTDVLNDKGRPRYQSVVMFDHADSPKRRYSMTSVELDEITEVHELTQLEPPRRASFTGIGNKESIAREYLSIDLLKMPIGEMKKSASSPLLSVELNPKHLRLPRPASTIFERIASATSLNKIFAEKTLKPDCELDGLLCETHI